MSQLHSDSVQAAKTPSSLDVSLPYEELGLDDPELGTYAFVVPANWEKTGRRLVIWSEGAFDINLEPLILGQPAPSPELVESLSVFRRLRSYLTQGVWRPKHLASPFPADDLPKQAGYLHSPDMFAMFPATPWPAHEVLAEKLLQEGIDGALARLTAQAAAHAGDPEAIARKRRLLGISAEELRRPFLTNNAVHGDSDSPLLTVAEAELVKAAGTERNYLRTFHRFPHGHVSATGAQLFDMIHAMDTWLRTGSQPDPLDLALFPEAHDWDNGHNPGPGPFWTR